MNLMPIRSNFKRLRASLEAKEGRRFSYKEIAEEIHNKIGPGLVSEPTLIRFANNKTKGVSYETLEGLCLFFRRRGIDCNPGDLLVLEEGGSVA